MSVELEFLTESETLRELSRRYWALKEDGDFAEPLSALALRFGIPVGRIPSTVSSSCVAFRRAEACSDCGAPQAFSSRADYTRRSAATTWSSWICPECQAERKQETKRQAEDRDRRRTEVLQTELDIARQAGLVVGDLSFEDALFLAAVARAGGAEDLSYIMPREYFRTPLSPTSEYDRYIFDQLYHGKVLCIHPGSRPESILMEETGFRFYPMKVHWAIPTAGAGPSPSRFVEDLERTLKSEASWPPRWGDEVGAVHAAVALQECLQYLRVVLDDHGFELNPGEKTINVLRAALRTFSIGQVFSFMWRAARDAAAFYVRESTSKSHAANIVPGAIQRSAERALAERWEVRAFRRDFRAPESVLSALLFNGVLQLPDGGFDTVPPTG